MVTVTSKQAVYIFCIQMTIIRRNERNDSRIHHGKNFVSNDNLSITLTLNNEVYERAPILEACDRSVR